MDLKYISHEEAVDKFLARTRKPETPLKVVESEKAIKEPVSMEAPEPKKEKHYEIPKVSLSEDIQKFDKKPKVYTKDPYAYNSVSLEKKEKAVNPGAEALLTNPIYNTIGKFLGVDMTHDWGRYADKVYVITEWAKTKTKSDDLNRLIKWIGDRAKSVPNLGNKVIDNLYIYARLSMK